MNGLVTFFTTLGRGLFALISRVITVLVRVFLLPARPLARQIDRSPRTGAFLNALSATMAAQRGLFILIGAGLTILSTILTPLIIVAMASSTKPNSTYLLCIPLALLHMGVLIGFAGILLIIPLGQGYKGE